MSSLPRVKASPALLPRALVSLGALVAIAWAALGYGSGAARAGPGFATELLVLAVVGGARPVSRSEEHTSEFQSQSNLVCRLLLEKKKKDDYHVLCPCCISLLSPCYS